MRNCECCHSQYEPYKIGTESEIFGYWCEITDKNLETKGLCGFCNVKSVWFVDKNCHKHLIQKKI